MRLYGAIEKIEAQTDGTVRVHGIAASEAVDEQGEIVRAAAMRAAMPDYMRFPALREMHQLSAAGTTLEAEVGEDGTTRIVAHVVDPVAVAKVKNQVYRGFSIGGRVTQRDAANPKVITALVLNEISLVYRPANPEAVFDCWKAALAADAPLRGRRAPVRRRRTGRLIRRSRSGPVESPITAISRNSMWPNASKSMPPEWLAPKPRARVQKQTRVSPPAAHLRTQTANAMKSHARKPPRRAGLTAT